MIETPEEPNPLTGKVNNEFPDYREQRLGNRQSIYTVTETEESGRSFEKD